MKANYNNAKQRFSPVVMYQSIAAGFLFSGA
jgi:hypothetical protein